MTTNADVISTYRDQKKQMASLTAAAQKQMQAQFTKLLAEAAEILTEFKADFGEAPELPAGVKTFTLNPTGTPKEADQSSASANGKKIGGLKRSLAAAVKNNDTARIASVTDALGALGVTITAEMVNTTILATSEPPTFE